MRAEQAAVRARVEQGFGSEDEMLTFFREVAATGQVEHSLAYAVDEQGTVSVLNYGGLDAGAGYVLIRPEELDAESHRDAGHKKIRLLHTHPTRSFELTSGAAPENIPPSLADMNVARITGYNNRFSRANLAEGAYPGQYTYENVVVTERGTWRYTVDDADPRFADMAEEQIAQILASEGTTIPRTASTHISRMCRTISPR